MKKFIPLLILMLITCSDTVKLIETSTEKCIPSAEVCNNTDDDCDKIIDNEEIIGVKPCYTSNTSELLNGICRFGVQRCLTGKEVCIGEVKPQEEICNGVDDNCNGQTDEGFSNAGLDLVFAIDYSGSMTDNIQAINEVVSTWTSSLANRQNVRFALIGIPPYDYGYDATVHVILNFTDYNTFNLALQKNKNVGPNGSEPSIDAVYKLSNPANPLGMNWTQGYTKAILLFTDEAPQSFTNTPTTEAEAIAMAKTNLVKVFVFTNDSTWLAWNTYPLSSSSVLLSTVIEAALSKTQCQ